jgi:cellulose synthase operon protein C
MKRLAIFTLLFLLGCTFNSRAAQEVSAERATQLFKQGSYKEAAEMFNALLAKNSNDEQAQRGLVNVLVETGDYPQAESKAKEWLNARPADAALRVALGEVDYQTGRYAEAAATFERAARDGKDAVMLRAVLGQSRALFAQGKDAEAQAVAQELLHYFTGKGAQRAEELTIIAQGMVLLEKYKEANETFIDAREIDPTYAEAFIAQGELFNDKYQYGGALSLFEDALKINPNSPRALLGLADCKENGGTSSSRDKSPVSIVNEEPPAAVAHAIAFNPRFADAHAMAAWQSLENEDFDLAVKACERALAANPNSIKALGVRASIFYLTDKKAELDADTKRALAINPHAGEFFDTLAHFAVNNRRYADAVEFDRRAVELSPHLWSAHTQLGIQLLRVGKITEGRAELERTFAGDPFNVWAKNTLDLLDSMKDFNDAVRGPFLVKSASKESGVLSDYALDLLEEANKKLTAKYHFTPRPPIGVEIFDSHDDFAVRSLGLPGLGALGVCFGQVIAMDSPSARDKGEFNWGSTLWHEFTHVITLQTTDHRIPRWFSEGLSVYEERRARPGWGDNWSLERLKAFADGRFVPIDDLDAAFTHPRTPDGVIIAYFQASQVCEFVEDKYGFDGILKMLALYKAGQHTPDVLQQALKLSPTDFDKAFNEYLRGKVGGYLEALGAGLRAPVSQSPSKDELLTTVKQRPNDYFALLRLGTMEKGDGNADQAIEHLKHAAEVYPYYANQGNPYELLAAIYEARDDKKSAIAMLEQLTAHTETNLNAMTKLARLKLATGDRAGAIETLKTSFYIQPFDAALHKLAGDVYLDLGNASDAAKEFRVVVALVPADMAAAHYDIARALDAGGNRSEARREVLRALEIAPGFDKAQELLLKLRGGN